MCDAAVKIAFSPLLTHHHLYTQHIYSIIIIIIKAKVSQDRQTDLFRAYCEYQNTTAREREPCLVLPIWSLSRAYINGQCETMEDERNKKYRNKNIIINFAILISYQASLITSRAEEEEEGAKNK